MNVEEILLSIRASECFADVRNSGKLPDPDGDDGYYLVSYSHADYKRVLPDVIGYRENGIKIWYDRGLESGKSWIGEVQKKISSYYCKGVLLYLSERYLQSRSCRTELYHVMREKKPCVPVFLDDAYRTYPPDPDAPEPLAEFAERFPSAPGAASLAEKIALLQRLPAPELLCYRYETMRIAKIFPIRVCFVTRLLDKNVRELTVPSTRRHDKKTYRVIGIAPGAVVNCEMLESVTLSDGWSAVLPKAFTGCPSLHTLILGKPRTAFLSAGIVRGAFDRCPNLREIVCKKGVALLAGTFAHNGRITSYTVPANFRAGGACFSDCLQLREVTLHKRGGIDGRMFFNCVSLQRVTIPANARGRTVGKEAFCGCESLTDVRLPDGTRTIEARAFRGCRSLERIALPALLTEIAPDAFEDCPALTEADVLSKKFAFLRGDGGVFLDDLFPHARRFYFRHTPPARAWRGNFVAAPSERDGYLLYVRAEEKGGTV